MRQPHCAKSSLEMLSRHSMITISARKKPSVAVVWIQLVS